MAARPVRSLKVVNWERWQSYRSDRGQPPWIKLWRAVLRNPEWISLDDAQRGQLVQIWLLAADKEGTIEAPEGVELSAFIRRVCCMESDPDLQLLESLRFIKSRVTPTRRQGDAKVTPTRRQPDANVASQSRVVKRREDKSREEPPLPPVGESVYPDFFIAFWNSYPKGRKGRRVGKLAALKAWKKLKPSPDLSKRIIKAIHHQSENGHFQGDNGKDFVPLPSTWLNQGRWDDDLRRLSRAITPAQQFRPPPPTDPATEAAYAKRREEFQRTQKQNSDRMRIKEPNSPAPSETDFKSAKEGLENLAKTLNIAKS